MPRLLSLPRASGGGLGRGPRPAGRGAALILLLVTLIITGCATPGMTMRDGPLADEPAETEQAEVIPITPRLIARQREARRPAAPPDLEQPEKFEPYRIGPRDILTITVWEHPELTIPAGQFRDAEMQGHRVSESGTLFYPYVGEIRAAGLTTEELRRELTQRLAQFITDPQLDVRIAAYRSKRAYIVGEVRNPGVQPVTDIPLTVAEAISLSGGVTLEGDLSNVTVARGDQVARLDLLAMYERGNAAQNILLKDGDVLSVPERADNRVFVMGEVLRPASVEMRRRGMTLAEALGEVGGPSQITANPGRIFVIRAGADERPSVYHLNARSADAMLLADRFEMHSRDVVYVDAAGVSRWNRFISQVLPTAVLLRTGQQTVD